MGLLFQASPRFRANFEQHLNNLLAADPLTLQNPAEEHHFFMSKHDAKTNSIDTFNVPPVFDNRADGKTTRDWNEEFQSCKELPKATVYDRISRDRAYHKIYSDFVNMATQGAVGIVEGSVLAMNPMEKRTNQLFLYNQIFLSFIIDDCLEDRPPKSQEPNASYTQANNDIKGLNSLHIVDLDGIYLLATCIVSYRGWRIMAQSLLPGILQHNEQTSLCEYGSVDDGKTI